MSLNKRLLSIWFLMTMYSQCSFADITSTYQTKITAYNTAISEGDYSSAQQISLELLEIDPADTVAALRFAIAAKLTGEEQSELLEELSHYLDQSTLEKKELLDLSKALVKQK
jgi:hypothetical protein